jgi:hypothetical protein
MLPYQPRPRWNTGPYEEPNGFQTPPVNWTINGPSGKPFFRAWPRLQVTRKRESKHRSGQ